MAKKKAKTKPCTIDWQSVRLKFVYSTSSGVSLTQFAKDEGMNAGGLRLRAAKEKWLEDREHHLSRVEAKLAKKVENKEVNRRLKMLTIADAMKAVGQTALKRLAEDLNTQPEKRLDTQEIRLLIKDAIDIEARLLGIPDVVLMDRREVEERIAAELERLRSLEDSVEVN
jgi:hypothetical protein